MYAIIQTGSKQYRVQQGDVIDVELLPEDVGQTVEFNDVLLIHNGNSAKVGAPRVAGAIVKGELVDHVRGPKVYAMKYKRRKKCRRKVGHRQDYARVKILEIAG
ncbi:MAG: ribosomal protein [Chlamydiales bacterium]|jgi:large subunit ribosomal protein L21|nr:ribosomal protein [Chlamydiales bacterium]